MAGIASDYLCLNQPNYTDSPSCHFDGLCELPYVETENLQFPPVVFLLTWAATQGKLALQQPNPQHTPSRGWLPSLCGSVAQKGESAPEDALVFRFIRPNAPPFNSRTDQPHTLNYYCCIAVVISAQAN